MWYQGRDVGGDKRVYYATSPDGLTWTKLNNIIMYSTDSGENSTDGRIGKGSAGHGDYEQVTGPFVIKDNGRYKMWYAGTQTLGSVKIYYATSLDGLTWTKYNNTIPADSDSASTDGRVPLGTSGTGDDVDITAPFVIKDNGIYKMWYSGDSSSTSNRIYHATSEVGAVFDGVTSYIDLGSNGFEETICNNGCSFCTWFEANDNTSSQGIIGRYDTTSGDKFFLLYLNGGNKVQFLLDDVGDGSDIIVASSVGSINANTWYHVCATYNGSNTTTGKGKLYLDNTFIGTSSGSTMVNSTAWQDDENMYIGTWDNSVPTTFTFNGTIRNAYIYNRTITEDEIENLYLDGVSGTDIYSIENKSLNLTGNSYVKTKEINIPVDTSYTISFWLKQQRPYADTSGDYIWSSIGADAYNKKYQSGGTKETQTRYYHRISNGTGRGVSYWLDSSKTYDWNLHTIVYDYDNSLASAYVNGILNNTQTQIGHIAFNITYIGAYTDGSAQLNASLDDFRVYDKALNTSEILELYYSYEIFSNISSYSTMHALTFDVEINASYSQTLTCGVYDNSSNITCTNVTITTGTNTSTCTIDRYINQNVTFTPYCNESTLFYNGTSQTIDVNTEPIIGSNLSSFNRMNTDFNVSITYDIFPTDATCGVYTNSSSINCTNVTSSSPVVSLCTVSLSTEENVSLTPHCNVTTNDYNGTSVGIYLDNVNPSLTLNTPNNENYYNITHVPLNVTFTDTSLFGYNVTCYNSSDVKQFTNQKENIATSSYDYYNTSVFNKVGNYTCTAIVADDHTATKFEVKSEVKESFLGLTNDKIEFNKGEVEFIWDKSNELSLERLEVEEKYDRVSPVIVLKKETIQKDKVDIKWKIKYSGKAYMREDNSNIPGHIVIMPDNNMKNAYWYDAVDDYDSKITTAIDGDEILYTATVSRAEIEKNNYIYTTESLGGLNFFNQSWNFTIGAGQNTTIYGYNKWNSSNIDNLTVRVVNSTNTTLYYTGDNHTIEFGCEPTIVTIYNSDYMNNYSYQSVDCNLTDYNNSFWQATVTINARNTASNALIPGASINITDGVLTNTTVSTTGSTLFYVNNDSYTMQASATNFNNSDTNTTVFAQNSTNTVNLYLNPIYNILFRREETNTAFNFSENATLNYTVYLDVYCVEDRLRFVIDEPTEVITGIDCEYDYWYITLITSTDSYFRTVKPEYNATNVSIYLLDLKVDTAIEMIFSLNDLVKAYDDGYLIAKKYVNTTLVNSTKVEVIKQQFDIESKTIFWLDENEQYEICAENDEGTELCLGNVIASAAGTKNLVLPGIPLVWEYDFDDVYYTFTGNKDTGKATLQYVDLTSVGYTNLTWKIYEYNTTTEVYSYSNLNGFNTTTIASNLNRSKAYSSYFYLDHKNNNYDIVINRPLWWASHTEFPGFESWEVDIKLWIASGVTILLMTLASIASAAIIMLVALAFTSIFYAFDWYEPLYFGANATIGQNGFRFFLILFGIFTFFLLLRKIKKNE